MYGQAALDAKAQVEQAVTDLSQRLQEMEEEAHEMIELKEANDATKSVAEQMAKESEQHRRRAQKASPAICCSMSSLCHNLGGCSMCKSRLPAPLRACTCAHERVVMHACVHVCTCMCTHAYVTHRRTNA